MIGAHDMNSTGVWGQDGDDQIEYIATKQVN